MTVTNLNLRSNIFASMVVVAPTGGYTAGDMVKVEDTVGVIAEDAVAGADAVLIYKCEKILVPKTAGTGIAFAAGDKVYYNETDDAVTTHTTSGTLCGRALVAAVAADVTVLIDLTGNIAA